MGTCTRAALGAALAITLSVPGWAADTLGAMGANSSEVKTMQVIEGSQKLIRRGQRVQRVAVGNPAVADVNILNTRDLMITGNKKGSTTLMVWNRGASAPEEFRIVVGSPYDPAIAVPNRLGSVQTQVMTDIKIAEVSRTALRQFGFNFFGIGGPGDRATTFSQPGTFSGVSATGGATGAVSFNSPTGFLPIGDAFNLLFSDSDFEKFGILSVLERQGLARVLAEPSLVAMSGQSASFLAGGEFPIPVQQSSGGSGGITVEFKQFGVRLTLTPTVLGNERIVLKVAPEVSELDFTAGVNAGGVSVPALTVRRTETTVELGNGESFVISGLVSQDTMANVDKVPYLGNIPILGAFFRSTAFERNDKELIMVVSPHLVRPMKRGTPTPPLPGSKYNDFNPSSGDLILYEDGDFDETNYGFSR